MSTPQTAPESILSQDHAPVTELTGACLCGVPGLKECRCAYGQLIRELIATGWGTSQRQAARWELPKLIEMSNIVLPPARRALLYLLARQWQGTVSSFLIEYGISRTTYDRMGLKIPKHNR